MSIYGKNINIYLQDGTSTGLKLGGILNHTIVSLACPRNRLPELGNFEECKRPGIYFLLGIDEISSSSRVYIGEGDNVLLRLKQHMSSTKDFWTEVILFTSKDDRMNKRHFQYLESRIIDLARNIKRYVVDNANSPRLANFSIAERDGMEEFLECIKILLGVHGHKFLDDLVKPHLTDTKFVKSNIPKTVDRSSVELFLKSGSIQASAILTDEGIVVLEGSQAQIEVKKSLAMGYRDLRAKLVVDGVLKPSNGHYIFTKNHLFATPTQAAATIVASSVNGRQQWRDLGGHSLKEFDALFLNLS